MFNIMIGLQIREAESLWGPTMQKHSDLIVNKSSNNNNNNNNNTRNAWVYGLCPSSSILIREHNVSLVLSAVFLLWELLLFEFLPGMYKRVLQCLLLN
jgi:hypothetical protein